MKIGLLCVLFSFVALSVGSAINESLTYDEVFYLEEGRAILSGGPIRDPYNPPLMPILAGLPVAMGWDAWIRSSTPALQAFIPRMVTILLGSILILSVYIVGTKKLSPNTGLVAAFLLAFHPSILAHSHYVTSDTGVTLFVFLAVVSLLKVLSRPSLLRILLFAGASGYAVGTKITSLVFIPAMAIVSLWQIKGRRTWQWIVKHWGKMATGSLCFFLLLWATFLFRSDVVIKPRPDETRVSSRLAQMARERDMPWLGDSIGWLETTPLPLGGFLAIVKNTVIRSLTLGGERPAWHTILSVLAAKTPLPLLILFVFGIVLMSRQTEAKKQYIALCAIAVFLMIAFAILGGVSPMVRYVLPLFPFAVLVGASVIMIARARWATILIAFLLLWYAWGSIRAYPHFISYANEFAGTGGKRYEKLRDSNLDWGQALPDLARYVRQKSFGKINFSYFGRDDAGAYGLPSPTAYGGWKFEDICGFHEVLIDPSVSREATIISVTNWYDCGYNIQSIYRKEKIRDIVAEVFLVF